MFLDSSVLSIFEPGIDSWELLGELCFQQPLKQIDGIGYFTWRRGTVGVPPGETRAVIGPPLFYMRPVITSKSSFADREYE